MPFLPTCEKDLQERGWDGLDFLIVSGDAYVDHPSFGTALLGRLLEAHGYRVGIIAQPDLEDPKSLLGMGRPRLAVLVASGVVDSMVNHYTAARKKRSEDRYAPKGTGGRRPERATIRYCNLASSQMPGVPLIIGGVEASLRRLAHYDYWDDKVRRSILQDSQADLLVYGMGEKPLLRIARMLARGVPIRSLTDLAGTCALTTRERLPKAAAAFLAKHEDFVFDARQVGAENLDEALPHDSRHVLLPDFDTAARDKTAYALSFRMLYLEQDPQSARTLLQPHGRRILVQNPPQTPLSSRELDDIYDLPFERRPHPAYAGGVPAVEEVALSITAHRGCFGGCHFCAISLHQGRIVQPRSDDSILREAGKILAMPEFKGYIHDVGGPTANFHQPACDKQRRGSVCRDRQCLFPTPCPALETDHGPYLELLTKLRQLAGVKKVFIRSGIRFDYMLQDAGHDFLTPLCEHHVSGQLKVAPEHVAENALAAMGKPPPAVYRKFVNQFEKTNEKLGKKQFLVPYLISGHPGCTLADAVTLAEYIRDRRVMPQQVQDFYPTPGTIATTMHYTGLDPLTLQPVHVVRGEEKALQRALLQHALPKNRALVRKALHLAGRQDLIGTDDKALVRPPSSKDKKRAPRPSKGRKRRHAKEDSHDHPHQRQKTGRRPQRKTGRAHRRGHRRP